MFLLLLIYVLQIFAFVGIDWGDIISCHIFLWCQDLSFFGSLKGTHQKSYLKQRLAIQALIPTGYMYLLLEEKNAWEQIVFLT